MFKSNIQLTSDLGTDFWSDSCGTKELAEALKHSAVGATSNPVSVTDIIKKSSWVYKKFLDSLLIDNTTASEEEIAWKIIKKFGVDTAKLLQPIFNKHGKKKGRLSLQVNPTLYRKSKEMIENGLQLSSLAPNIAIKVPCTEAGLEAIEILTSRGIVVNGTLSYTVAQAVACAEAIERGLNKAKANSVNIDQITPYVTIMVGRLDDYLKKIVIETNKKIDAECLNWAGIAVFKKTYQIFKERKFRSTLLAAAYRNYLHWYELIGGEIVLTIPYVWWKKINDIQIPITKRINVPVQTKFIELLYTELVDFRKAYEINGMQPNEFVHYGATVKNLHQFTSAYYKLLNYIKDRRTLY